MSKDFNFSQGQDILTNLLLDGDTDQAMAFTKITISDGISPMEYFEGCIAPSLEKIGEKFESLEIFLPEMVFAADIVQKINDEILTPAVKNSTAQRIVPLGKVLLATVQGDLHDIGKNMVALLLRVNGFEVLDLGINVHPEEIISQAEREHVNIIGMSSLLTTCLPYMKDVFNLLNLKGTRERYAIILGGAAPTPDFAAGVCADGYGHSAAEAVTLCKKIMETRS